MSPVCAESADDLLVNRLHGRDQEALLTLYQRHHLRVFALALRIVKDRPLAEEILQDVFFRLWENPASYKASKGQLLSWLLVVARNLSLDRVRGEIRRSSRIVFSIDDLHAEAAAPAVDSDAQRTFEKVLAALPAPQRQALELIYFEGLTHVELAEKTGEALGTVKTRVRLGMAKLKESLQATRLSWL